MPNGKGGDVKIEFEIVDDTQQRDCCRTGEIDKNIPWKQMYVGFSILH